MSVAASFLLLAASIHPAADSPADYQAVCANPISLPGDLVAREPRFVIVGEIHGTDTSPEAFGALACSLAFEREVLIQFELPPAWGVWIDDYVQTGDAASREKLLTSYLFTSERYDGRASSAFVDLLDNLRQMKRAGAKISVAAFQPDMRTIEPQYYYELSMAEHLARNAVSKPDAINLVLVGNYHAERSESESDRRSAASFLRGKDFIALNQCYQGGSASVRMPDEDGNSVNSQMTLPDSDAALPRGIHPSDTTLFDGKICAGRAAKASPRAVPAIAED